MGGGCWGHPAKDASSCKQEAWRHSEPPTGQKRMHCAADRAIVAGSMNERGASHAADQDRRSQAWMLPAACTTQLRVTTMPGAGRGGAFVAAAGQCPRVFCVYLRAPAGAQRSSFTCLCTVRSRPTREQRCPLLCIHTSAASAVRVAGPAGAASVPNRWTDTPFWAGRHAGTQGNARPQRCPTQPRRAPPC